MPKISKRGHRQGCTTVTAASVAMKARKVSFEDGSSDQSHEDESMSVLHDPVKPSTAACYAPPNTLRSVPSLHRCSPCQNMERKHKVLKRRSTPSVSLTELLAMSPSSTSAEETSSSLFPPLSATSQSTRDTSSSPLSSPWGHFVDVVPDHEDDVAMSSYDAGSPSSSLRWKASTSGYHPYQTTSHPPLRIRKSKTFMNGFLLSLPQDASTTQKKNNKQDNTGVESALEGLRM